MFSMKKKIIKKEEELFTAKDVGRYLGALSEEFQGRVRALAEITLGLDKKMENGFSKTENSFSKVENSFSEMRDTMKSHTEMIGAVATDVEIIKQDIEFLKGGFRKKTDYDEFLTLEHRVSALESLVRK